MSLRRTHSWVWWLLPFLVARALVPVGFMARVSDGHLNLVFCAVGYAGSKAIDDRAGRVGVDNDGVTKKASDDRIESTQADFSCPFSQVAAAPLLDVSASEAIPYNATTEIPAFVESLYYAVGPPRFIATRGPPVLA